MAEKAHVGSVEALEAFRAVLILYVSKARPALEEVNSEVARTRQWLQGDQRMYWEGLLRRRSKELEQAQAALSSARVSNLRQSSAAEQMAVLRARRGVEEAEGKLKVLKQWNREFDSRVEPLVKQLEKLHTFLAHDLGKAAAFLAQAVQTLSAYSDAAPGTAAGPSNALPGGGAGEANLPGGEKA